MAQQHKDITGSEVHITKGADSAAANTVKYANGSGGEGWSKVTKDMVDATTIPNINNKFITAFIPAIGTAGTLYIAAPVACKIVGMYLTSNVTLSGTVVVTGSIGGTPITNGSISQLNPAAGTSYSAAPTAANVLTAGQVMKFDWSGTTTASAAHLIIVLDN